MTIITVSAAIGLAGLALLAVSLALWSNLREPSPLFFSAWAGLVAMIGALLVLAFSAVRTIALKLLSAWVLAGLFLACAGPREPAAPAIPDPPGDHWRIIYADSAADDGIYPDPGMPPGPPP